MSAYFSLSERYHVETNSCIITIIWVRFADFCKFNFYYEKIKFIIEFFYTRNYLKTIAFLHVLYASSIINMIILFTWVIMNYINIKIHIFEEHYLIVLIYHFIFYLVMCKILSLSDTSHIVSTIFNIFFHRFHFPCRKVDSSRSFIVLIEGRLRSTSTS